MPVESVEQAPATAAEPAQAVAQAAPAQPAPAPTPPPQTQTCAQCGATIAPGRRFCTSCGNPVHAGVRATPRSTVSPGASTPVPWVKGRSRSELMVAGGYVLAAIATFLAWFTFDTAGISISVSGWDDGVRFRVADWFGTTAPVDALLVVALAILGMIASFAPRYLQVVRRLPHPGAIPAGLIVLLAVLEIQLITRDAGELGNVGIGIWAMLIGGGVALFGSLAAEGRASRPSAAVR